MTCNLYISDDLHCHIQVSVSRQRANWLFKNHKSLRYEQSNAMKIHNKSYLTKELTLPFLTEVKICHPTQKKNPTHSPFSMYMSVKMLFTHALLYSVHGNFLISGKTHRTSLNVRSTHDFISNASCSMSNHSNSASSSLSISSSTNTHATYQQILRKCQTPFSSSDLIFLEQVIWHLLLSNFFQFIHYLARAINHLVTKPQMYLLPNRDHNSFSRSKK